MRYIRAVQLQHDVRPIQFVHKLATNEIRPPVLAAPLIIDAIGRGERIRTSDLSVPNHRFGKKLSFCHFESCSHHEFIRVLRFLAIRYHRIRAIYCKFCPQIGHNFYPRALFRTADAQQTSLGYCASTLRLFSCARRSQRKAASTKVLRK